jgi:apolipoprotein N-acyltransferase
VATPTLAVGPDGGPVRARAPRRRPARGWRPLLAAVSGLALAAAFPALDWEPLAWVGLVPLLVAVRDREPPAAFGLGWLAGFAFYLASLYWVAYTIVHYTALPLVAAVGVLVLMVSVLACYLGAFAAGLRWLERAGLPALWLAAPLWVTLEWLRGWFFIGFPWALLGYSQYRYHDLVQMAEVTGVYGISAVLVLFNAVTAEVLRRRGEGLRRRVLPALVALTVLLVCLPALGRWRAEQLRARAAAGRLTVAIVQGNVEQDHKWDPAYQSDTMHRYRELTRASFARHPDLVVWPETATPFFFQEPGPLRREVLELAREGRTYLVFGSPAAEAGPHGPAEANRAYLVSPAGEEVAFYDKMQLVPFGEYVPFQSVLFFVHRIVDAVGDVVAGRVPTVFRLPQGRFGVLICYESIFPALTRRFVTRGAELLVNISNDAWYGRTAAPHQLLAHVTLRAVENRVPIVRAANTGVSAIIDPDGRIRWQGPLFEPLWHADEIAWQPVQTFYTRFGDVFAWACALATLGAFGYGAWRWRRRR